MSEINNIDTFDEYVNNCNDEESRSYEATGDLEAKYAGYFYMGRIDWEAVDRAINWPAPSDLTRSNEQGEFVPTDIDDEVFGLFTMDCVPAPQVTSSEGIGYGPNQMNGYIFGETETTQTVPMDYQPDFVYDAAECQYSYYTSDIAPPPPPPVPQMEEKMCEKDWTTRDENTGKIRPPLLHEYLRKLLDDPNYSHVASYVDRRKGIFKFHDKDLAARFWQEAKQRNCDSDMTYEKFARAIRHYYDKDIIRRYRAHFTFCFGPNSGFGTTWSPA